MKVIVIISMLVVLHQCKLRVGDETHYCREVT